MGKLDYSLRTPSAKVTSNWTKTRGLFDREDWSMSIVRAAICVELAANCTIRSLLSQDKTPEEIDEVLIKLNGVEGKLKYLAKLTKGTNHRPAAKAANDRVASLRKKRNKIVHGGFYANEPEAKELVGDAYAAITGIVTIAEPGFALKAILTSKRLRTKARQEKVDESDSSDSDSSARY